MRRIVKLNLGVADVAYSDASAGGNSNKTTGDVAEILEDKYAVMGTFFDLKGDKVADLMAEALGDYIADVAAGAPVSNKPLQSAMEKIEALFRQFLDDGEMAHLVSQLSEAERAYFMDSTGGFNAAASRGRNSRKKKVESGKSRVAFVDTGLYQQSFRAWFAAL